MSPEYHRGDDPGVHGGGGVREAVQAQEADPDPTVQQTRGHLSAGRRAVPHVPRGRHEEVAHHRGPRPRSAHQEEGQ